MPCFQDLASANDESIKSTDAYPSSQRSLPRHSILQGFSRLSTWCAAQSHQRYSNTIHTTSYPLDHAQEQNHSLANVPVLLRRLRPQIGCLTDYHIATLGHCALKGAGLVFIEATAVQPNGRITPNCAGLWCDAQIEGVKRVADFVHSQGALCGIQLAHAGRKSSIVAPWIAARSGGCKRGRWVA